MSILSMNMSFTLKSMGRLERTIVVESELKDQLLMSLKLIIIGTYMRWLNCNIIARIIKSFLFKFYFYDRGIIVDSHFGLIKINTKTRLHNVDDILVFSKQYQQIYYIHTTSFRKDRSRVD
jgi:hypothetical protein